MDDFRKYATKHLGMNSLVLDDVIKSQAGYFHLYQFAGRFGICRSGYL